MAHSKRLGWAAGLLGLAFPAAAKAVLAALGSLAALVLTHLPVACSVVAVVLLTSTLPALRRRVSRARRRRELRGLMSTIRFDLAGGTR
ncbi:hypothetical protein ACFVVX_01180 [Kitasatospora sp. NPDC058170]|uniref:hypothetical protein n=1 Tax=Kitasatospora sp. NPDC058170 TaxID=3346364 RepID=UPI0036D8C2B1